MLKLTSKRYGPLEERFWAKVLKTDYCWNWQGSTSKGYGKLSEGVPSKKLLYAHRVSWKLHFGQLEDFHVLHICDNPLCVRPSHLFLGSNFDNVQDRVNKNRSVRLIGLSNPQAKLTQAEVDEMRRVYAAGNSSWSKIAKRFGISKAQAGRIINRKSWPAK